MLRWASGTLLLRIKLRNVSCEIEYFRRNSSLQAAWGTSIACTHGTGFMRPHQGCHVLIALCLCAVVPPGSRAAGSALPSLRSIVHSWHAPPPAAVSCRHSSATAEAYRVEGCSCNMTLTSGVGLFQRTAGGQRAAGGPPLRHALLPPT